jgi:phosphoadenosine phosphosulfate reductase
MLAWAASTFGSQNLAFATSLGAEDQVLTDLISGLSERIPVFTLDTGRLFQETYDLIERVRSRYAIDVAVYAPEAGHVEEMVHTHGPNLFYNSVELRKRCCHVRKVLPLQRALAGRVAWITGLRRDQSVTRSALEPIEWDEARGLFKLAPLASWSEEQVWSHIRTHDVPYHKLHDQGFRSIGCAPCTRAVGPDEDVRAGRWWWEHPAKKECGLHAR